MKSRIRNLNCCNIVYVFINSVAFSHVLSVSMCTNYAMLPLKLFGPSLSMSSDFDPSMSGPAFSFDPNENAGPDNDGPKSEDIDSDGPKSLSEHSVVRIWINFSTFSTLNILYMK